MIHHLSRRELLKAGTAAAVSISLSCNGGSTRTETNRKKVDLEQEILIPEGEFLMGTSEGQVCKLSQDYDYHPSWFSGELPLRKIFLPGFKIDKYPVTNGQYAAFCKSKNHRPPSSWKDGKAPERLLDHPVAGIAWPDAVEYARWMGKRLPTEAEWEKAARGTTGRTFPWGNSFNSKVCVWNRSHVTENSTDSVCAHPGGASPYGVMDMCGNLAEWCQDGPSDYVGFIKGGSWINNEPFFLRPACRSMSGAKNNACSFYGFRCVSEVK